jgi:Tfp pilus assembly protein PilV
MVELLIAMTVLAVGILVTFGMFNAGMIQIRRAGTISTASALAETEMEKLRAVKYSAIGLLADGTNGIASADATYKADAAYRAVSNPQNQGGSAVVIASSTLVPTKVVPGADGRNYRVDTYVTWRTVTAANGAVGRDVKLATIVVRAASSSTVWARATSSFDEATGR